MNLRSLWFSTCVLLLVSVTTPVAARDGFEEAVRISRELEFEQRGPFGGLAEFAYLRRSWSVNSFYTVLRGQYPNQSRFWVVRRVAGAPGQPEAVLWADSRTCRGVEPALTAMERMPPVTPDAPQLGSEKENLGIVLDGTHHIFWNRWARSGRNDATVGLEITGNVNSPMAQWWSDTADALSGCWQVAKPE